MSNFVLFKDLTPGSIIYALIKNPDELNYIEGSIVSIGQQRIDMPDLKNGQIPNFSQTPKTVVDVTYSLDGKNYTDAVEVTAYMFPTEKPGAISLITTDKDSIIRELHATRKRSEDYIKNVETEVPRNKKRIDDCKALIGLLDTKYAEKQELENRIKKLEDGNAETNRLLNQILDKIK
jgi:hypothetical protein